MAVLAHLVLLSLVAFRASADTTTDLNLATMQKAIPHQTPMKAFARTLLASNPSSGFAPVTPTKAMASKTAHRQPASRMAAKGSFDVREMAGVTAPLGFWDPLGFSEDATEGKIRFYREVELKHGRVAMLAALGFLVGENYHPLFGGNIDTPAYRAFQETPLQSFWPLVVAAISIPEIFSVFSFKQSPAWTIRDDHYPGDFGFDPLGLKPEDPEELKMLQTKEINNGRLAMIGIAGMIAQELVDGLKVLQYDDVLKFYEDPAVNTLAEQAVYSSGR